jgi:hypothetical protein
MMKEMGKTDPNYAIFVVSIPMYEPLEVTKCKNYVCMHIMNGLWHIFHLINDAADFFWVV